MADLPEITQLDLGTFRFPDSALQHRRGVVMGYAIRHRGGIFLFDTGLGFGNKEIEEAYHPIPRVIGEVLAEAGLSLDDVTAVANCHLHADHSGQNAAFPDRPIYVRTPQTITVSPVEPIAFEQGDWTGTSLSGVRQAGGIYTAKWRHIASSWCIEADLYLTLS